MGFLEIFGERFNRGPVGRLRIDRPQQPESPSPYASLWLIAALIVLSLWTLLLWRASTTWTGFLVAAALSALYIAVAPAIRSEPDYSNVGYLGGLIDHPFRFSDDLNRFLAFLVFFFWPGRLIAAALRHGFLALRGR